MTRKCLMTGLNFSVLTTVHVIKVADPKGLKPEVMLETGGLGADIIIDQMVSVNARRKLFRLIISTPS